MHCKENTVSEFSARLLGWQQIHGRTGLPWQNTKDPYRVWLSEIMLQQTQVRTVLPYYARFLASFPCLKDLALATPDEVMALWSGLGYYSRARNLHRCAQQILNQYAGIFPQTAIALKQLPGIGSSTAAAIAAFCFGERISILDANVKRVLSRVFGFQGDLSKVAENKALQTLADALVPASHNMSSYTQALMDFGAIQCVAKKPNCKECIFRGECWAEQNSAVELLPRKSKTLKRSQQTWQMLLVKRKNGDIALEKRPDHGIWAGLWCLPVVQCTDTNLENLAYSALLIEENKKHVLTHVDLYLNLYECVLKEKEAFAILCVNPAKEIDWFKPEEARGLGLPAPIRAWLEKHL